jgi:hypothetical protein
MKEPFSTGAFARVASRLAKGLNPEPQKDLFLLKKGERDV